MKKLIIVSLILLLCGMAFGARKALVIGNARYADKPLKNPTNDAELMKKTLNDLNFDVKKFTDVNLQAFNNAIREFANNLDIQDEVVFYYSGHGVQINGENFLLPVGEKFEDASDIENKGVSLNWITTKLNSTSITMIFLDACRDNPFSSYRSSAKGLAMAGASGNNMFMMYSTEAGSVANDGKGNNSDFTQSLTTQLTKPGLSLDDISTNVTAEVRELTNNAQRPWKIGSLSYKYYFIEPEGGVSNVRNPYGASAVYGSRYSSTVEERLKKKDSSSSIYNPGASKYIVALSAHEFLIENSDDVSYTKGQFISRNSFGMKIPIAGAEAFYNVIKTWQNSDFSTGAMLNQMGAGAGLPNPELIRIFAYGIQNDLSSYAPYESYFGFKAQAVKRIRSAKQFSELGVDFEFNDVPQKLNPTGWQPVASYFDPTVLDWTPNKRLNAWLLASSLNNRYLEANNFRGLGPASSPLLLANQRANALIARIVVEDRKTDFKNERHAVIDFMMPLNFGKVVGTDFGYRYTKDQNWKADTSSTVSDLSAGLRITFLPLENFRLIGSAEYQSSKTTFKTENLYFAGHAVVKLSHHFAAMAVFKHRSIWQRNIGFTEIDPHSYHFGSAITVRL